MKRKIVALLLAMSVSVSLAGCGEQSASGESGSVLTEKDGAAEDAGESVASPYEGDYAHVATRMLGGEMEYSQYEMDFKGHEGEFTIKGYYCQDNFYNGITAAVTLENNEFLYTVIDTAGKELVDRTKYEYFTRVGETHDYFVVKNKQSQLFGVINREGEEVVPCQYEEINPRGSLCEGAQEYLYIYECLKGGTYDYYQESGALIVEGLGAAAFLFEAEGDESENRLITLKAEEKTYYAAEGKSGLLFNPDDYVWGPQYSGEHVFTFKKTEDKQEHIVFNEDWSSSESIPLEESSRICPLGDNWLVYGYNFGGLAICDKQWNELQSFGGAVSLAQDAQGNYTFVSRSRSQDGDVMIWDENFEQIATVPNRQELKVAGGLLYGSPLNKEGDSIKVYDMYGNVLYENVSDIRDGGEDYIWFTLEDGTFAFKRQEMSEVVLAGKEEACVDRGSGASWFCFATADGKYVYRDRNMEFMASFDGKADYKEALGYFYLDGKYYDLNGEFAFEEAW